MKILYCITKSGWGGAQRYVADMADAAKDAGHEVVVVCGENELGGRDTLRDRLAASGVRIVVRSGLGRDVRIVGDVVMFFRFVSLFFKEKPDVVHLNSSKAAFFGVVAGWLVGVKKRVYTTHGLPFLQFRGLVRAVVRAGSVVTALFATDVICVSAYERDLLARYSFLKKKLVVIYNGVEEFAVLSQEEARSALMEKYPRLREMDTDGVWIGSVAELVSNKNIGGMLGALAELDREFVYIHFGDGEEYERLEQRAAELGIAERVAFLGFDADAREFLGAFDIVSLPSKKEGFPYLLLEAGIAGCAVMASDVGGVPEVVADGEVGLLVPAEDGEALVGNLRKLCDDRGLREWLGEALGGRVRERFLREGMVEKTLARYL